jgi:heterotetrameric sarcosine oxidase gamma subunit
MLERVHPLEPLAANVAHCAAVSLAATPPVTRIIIRATPDAIAVLGELLEAELPTLPCRSRGSPEHAALWLGPDEWLLLSNQDVQLPTTHPSASIVDVSHAMAGIVVEGPRATRAINAHSALDLHDAAFLPGMCTRTVFAKAQIVLWCIERDVFRIEVARSFAPYVWDLLEEARREFLA